MNYLFLMYVSQAGAWFTSQSAFRPETIVKAPDWSVQLIAFPIPDQNGSFRNEQDRISYEAAMRVKSEVGALCANRFWRDGTTSKEIVALAKKRFEEYKTTQLSGNETDNQEPEHFTL